MERKTNSGIYYKNDRLGVEEDIYPLNCQFEPEGKEKEIAKNVYIIGHIPPVREDGLDPSQVIIADNSGVLFMSTERAVRYSHKEIKP